MIPSVIVTSWPGSWTHTVGARFLSTWEKHWNQFTPFIPVMVRGELEILKDPAVRAFREREAKLKTCKDSDIHKDVLKWSWKVFALTVEPMPTEGWMLWIDGDVEFIKTPTQEFFDAVCPEDKDVTFLGRPWAYASETGFVGYHMGGPARELLKEMRETYLLGQVRCLDEWGDAGVFDACRRVITLRENDLAAHLPGPALHVWPDTVLAPFLTHNKGPRRRKAAYGV